MGCLILRLLGTPEESHAKQPLTFQTRKVLALLAYLAVEQGVHSRDKITALLWPESDEERGKASLRRALAYLRESLDEPSHERSGHMPLQPPHVLIEHYTLSFNLASDFEIDTQTLQTAFTLARRRSPDDLRTHLAHLQMALPAIVATSWTASPCPMCRISRTGCSCNVKAGAVKQIAYSTASPSGRPKEAD